MNSAIIHFEPVFSKLDQSIFIKRTLKKVKKNVVIEKKAIPVYILPLCQENPSEKAMMKFISYLKAEGIQRVLLSDAAETFPIIDILKENISIITGMSVINYKIYDILRKCAGARELSLENSTLLLYTNRPALAKELILKIHKHVKKIKIETEKPELFTELTDHFLEEYGIFISVNQERTEEDLKVQLDGIEKKVGMDLYINEEKPSNILFFDKNAFAEIKPFKKLNQSCIEFLIDQYYGTIKNETIRQIFKDYSVRITKIENND